MRQGLTHLKLHVVHQSHRRRCTALPRDLPHKPNPMVKVLEDNAPIPLHWGSGSDPKCHLGDNPKDAYAAA